jgi:hypothetical protein
VKDLREPARKQFGIEYERKCWINDENGRRTNEFEYRRGVWWKDTDLRYRTFSEIEELIASWSDYAKKTQLRPRIVWREIGEWTSG